MRQTKAAFSEILNEHKSRPLISVTIYLTVTVCFLAAFISMRVLQKDAVIFEDQYSARCTYKDIILDTVQYGSAAELAASLTKLNDIGASVKGVGFSSVDDPLTFELEGLGRMSAGMKVIPDSEYAYPGNKLMTLMLYIYRKSFSTLFYKDVGVASSASFMLFLFIIIITIIQMRVTGEAETLIGNAPRARRGKKHV